MSHFKIITDSSCDLPENLLQSYDVSVTDLIINFPDQVYRDRKDITTEELLKRCDAKKTFPKTSALNIPELMDTFSYELKTNEHLFYLPISSAISSLSNNACLAAEQMQATDKITVLESASLSSGIGLEVIGLGEDIRKGLSLEEIVHNHEERVKRICMSFVIDTMDYLYRGGRCSGMTYLIGNKLHLHPIIRLDNGKMNVHKLVRGKDINRGVREMIDEFQKQLDNGNIDLSYPILIPNVEAGGAVHHLRHEMDGIVGSKILFPVDASGIICCHCGRNTCGLAYMLKNPLK